MVGKIGKTNKNQGKQAVSLNIKMGNGSITINGKSFTGRNVVIVNGNVVVDGQTVDSGLTGDINVVVNGHVEHLENHCGNVAAQSAGNINTGSGDVNCGDVTGNVQTGSGDVKCGRVGGSVRTGSGDVIHR